MVLLFYGGRFGYNRNKDIFLLTINEGNPFLYMSEDSYLTSEDDLNLDDGEWHHISISMPSDSCLLSEVFMYVDGKKVETFVTGPDKNIFYITSGSLSLGGWGYSSDIFGVDIFPDVENFEGMMDEFRLWGGTKVPKSTLKSTFNKHFAQNIDMKCAENETRERIGRKRTARQCRDQCNNNLSCTGYELVKRKHGRRFKCFHYTTELSVGAPENGSQCNPVSSIR